jgi:hypothetical protein
LFAQAQISHWEENLERLQVEQFRLRCYMASLQAGELPNPKVKEYFLSICSDKCGKVFVSMFEIIFDINGAKAYVKNLRVLSKIRGTWLYEIF